MKKLFTIILLLLLVACGGGSSGSSSSGNEDSSTGDSATETEETTDIEEFASQMVAQINAVRSEARSCGTSGDFDAADPVIWNDLLALAAEWHSEDMAENDFFSHTGSDGSDIGERLETAGYSASAWGENIAAGYGSIEAVVTGWVSSPGHCVNIMNPNFSEIGAYQATSDTATYSSYWTLALAKPE